MSRRPKVVADPPPALERAALLGREFPLALLKASGVSADAIAALFDEGILVESSQPAQARFAVAGRAKKIAEGIPWSRARDHHLALGQAAKQQQMPPPQVAAHFEAAHRFDLARAQWMKAGEACCHASDYRSALGYFDRALAIWPWDEVPEDRVRVLREIARCASNARLDDHARKAWEELAEHARDKGCHRLRVECLHSLAGLSADPVQTGSLLAEAAQVAGDHLEPHEILRHGMAHVDHLLNRVRVGAAKQALVRIGEAVERSGDPALRAEYLGSKALVFAMAGEADLASQWVEESLRLAIGHNLPEMVAFAYKRRANVADYAGKYVLERDSHHVAIRYCKEANTGEEVVCMGCLSYACFRTGDWEEALDTAREVLEVPDLHRALKAIALSIRGMVGTFRGERGPAFKALEESLRCLRAEGMAGMEFLALWALAYWHEQHGEKKAATAIYDEIRALWRETDDLHDAIPGLLFAGAHYADLGRAAQLADCIDILGRIIARNDLPEARAALLALGAEQARLEGDAEGAERALREAARLEVKAGLPLERLWIECRMTKQEEPRESIALATKLGAKPLLAVLKGKEKGCADLTPRQCEVISFLAAGLTSKEIGDRMGLSTRTVEMHVGRLLQRLGCRTRPEAVAIAQARGWLKMV
jgi:DNA-binding NarL/FixJ family response regulator